MKKNEIKSAKGPGEMHWPRIVTDKERRALEERCDFVNWSAQEGRRRRSQKITSLCYKRRLRV